MKHGPQTPPPPFRNQTKDRHHFSAPLLGKRQNSNRAAFLQPRFSALLAFVFGAATLVASSAEAQQAVGAAPAKGINYWQVMTGGGPVVVGVLLLLLASSVACWGIIFRKVLHLRKAQSESLLFLDAFWKEKRLDTVYRQAEELVTSPVAQVFRAGYVELSKINASPEALRDPGSIENIERALRRTTNSELVHLESTIPFLATTAAAAPFIGLLGTVWGIMGAFHDITQAGNASLTTVAGPIAEALIATAVGLFAAIPAVVAYNYFASRIRTLENEMENFGADFLNIVKRHFLKPRQGA